MQTNNLPIQANPSTAANALSAAQRGGAASAGAGQFSAMLSSEMEQRQASAPPPAPQAPAPKAPAAKAPAEQNARPADKAQDSAPADAAASQPASTTGKADADDADKATTKDASGDGADKPTDPGAAMLALMASLQPQAADAKDAAAKPGAAAFDALTGARGKRGDAGQLAALQATLKGARDTGADAGLGKAFAAAAGTKNLAQDAAAGLVADDKALPAATAGDAADLHAVLARVKGDAVAQAGEALPQAAHETANPVPSAAQIAAAQVQPAVMEAAQAAAAATDNLPARVGTQEWDYQVGQKVMWMVGSEEQTASLTLNPPDLGPMQVVLSVTGDQASVTFSANQQEVRDALENALPRLREMMSESGIALANSSVNAGMPDQRQAQDQSQRGDGRASWGHTGGRRAGGRDDGPAVVETTVRPARTRALGDNGMVDTFA